MPSACVTVIITAHHLTVEGAGIRCHRHVTDCWLTTPATHPGTCSKHNIGWNRLILRELIRLTIRAGSRPGVFLIGGIICSQSTLSRCRSLKMTPVFPPVNLRSQLVLWRKSGRKRWMVCFQFVISDVCLNTTLEWPHLLRFCFGLHCAPPPTPPFPAHNYRGSYKPLECVCHGFCKEKK